MDTHSSGNLSDMQNMWFSVKERLYGSEFCKEDLVILQSWSSRINSWMGPSDLEAGREQPRLQAQKKPRKSAKNKEESKGARDKKKVDGSAQKALSIRRRETQKEELAVVLDLCKENPVIPCHSCGGKMKILKRRIYYKGGSKEYLAYRCSKKHCQTFVAPRSLYRLLIQLGRGVTEFSPVLVSNQLQAALRDESLSSDTSRSPSDSRRLKLRQRIADLLQKAVASYEARAHQGNRTEPDANRMATHVCSAADSVGLGSRNDPISSKESLLSLETVISSSVSVPLKRFSTSSSDSGEASSVFHFNDVEKTETLFGIDTSETTNEKRTPGLEDVKVGIPLISTTAYVSPTDEVELSNAEEKSMVTMPTLLSK